MTCIWAGHVTWPARDDESTVGQRQQDSDFGEMRLTRSRAQQAARSFPLCSSLYDERGAMQWYDLPRDVLLPILDRLDVDDLSSLEATSRRSRQVVSAT